MKPLIIAVSLLALGLAVPLGGALAADSPAPGAHALTAAAAAPAEKPWTRIESNPSGATILIDGKKHGITPAKVEWPDGKPFTLTLKKGVQKAVVKLSAADKNKTKRVTLKGGIDTSPF